MSERVSVSFGATISLGKETFQSVRPEVSLTVDVQQDETVEAAYARASMKVMTLWKKELYRQVMEIEQLTGSKLPEYLAKIALDK